MATPAISVRTVRGVTVIRVHGPLTLGHSALDQLRALCAELCQRDSLDVVLDLGGMTAIDSSGIGTLLHGYAAARERGGTCKLVNVGRFPREVLELVGLMQVFETYNDEGEALASFAA